MNGFTHIKTSKENKMRVTELTRRLQLGAENVIARIALAYSLSKGNKFKLTDIQDAGGKEYNNSVLFGSGAPYYIALFANHYNIYKTDRDISKYIKMHLDDGLELIDEELKENPNIDSFDFLIQKIDGGLNEIRGREDVG